MLNDGINMKKEIWSTRQWQNS